VFWSREEFVWLIRPGRCAWFRGHDEIQLPKNEKRREPDDVSWDLDFLQRLELIDALWKKRRAQFKDDRLSLES
jgi:hypothetical protein